MSNRFIFGGRHPLLILTKWVQLGSMHLRWWTQGGHMRDAVLYVRKLVVRLAMLHDMLYGRRRRARVLKEGEEEKIVSSSNLGERYKL